MPGLSETISGLSQMRGLLPQQGSPVIGDRLTDLDDFGSNPGQLRALVYIPENLPRGAALVVVLHGCTQTAAGYDVSSGWSQMADEHGFALLFPEQRRANNPNLCFNWFVPQHAKRDSGEPLSIKQMVATMRARHGIDPARIFVTGLSAGGAMTSVMLATYPDIFAGGAIIAGLPHGMASSVSGAFQLMNGKNGASPVELDAKVRSASSHKGAWPTISVWHGTADTTVDASNAAAVVDQWRLVHGVPAEPDDVSVVRGFPRRAWRDAQGRDVIEEYIIPGMAHGTPLDTKSGTGKAAAFMLDVGICSTQEISRFWGLTDGTPTARTPVESASTAVVHMPAAPDRPARGTERLTREDKPSAKPPASGVGKAIEDALRAAGLMK